MQNESSSYQPDFDYLDDLSGENGALAHATDLFGKMNGSMTSFLDAISSPDEVDTFDASCNTCRHFLRAPMTPEQKRERNIFGMPGRCSLKGTAAVGWQRGQSCGFENVDCYENRRTGKRPAEAKIFGLSAPMKESRDAQ